MLKSWKNSYKFHSFTTQLLTMISSQLSLFPSTQFSQIFPTPCNFEENSIHVTHLSSWSVNIWLCSDKWHSFSLSLCPPPLTFQDMFSQCSLVCSGTVSVIQAGLGWSWTKRSTCLWLPSAGIKDIYHQTPKCLSLFKCTLKIKVVAKGGGVLVRFMST